MELVDGTTLGDRIPKGGMPLDDVLKLTPAEDAITFLRQRLGSWSLWNQPLAGGDQELVLDLGPEPTS